MVLFLEKALHIEVRHLLEEDTSLKPGAYEKKYGTPNYFLTIKKYVIDSL